MNLQELLKSLELSDESIAQVNKAVDTVIESKLAGQTDNIKALEDELTKTKGDLSAANEELAPVKEAAKKEKLTSLMPDEADPDKHADIISLAGIADEDDDEAIKSKLADTVSSRDYLKKPTTEDETAAKVSTEKNKTEDKQNPEEESNLPAGVK